MNVNAKHIELNKKLITVLDELLATGDWQVSLFLKAASKQISELRQQAEQLLIEATGSMARIKDKEAVAKSGYRKVFVSVYQAEGTNLQQWHRTLKSLTDYSISRPIYDEQEHIRAMIRAKADKQREAYAIVYVREDDILTSGTDKLLQDRFGNKLLALKMGAVKPINIVEFVHCDKHYFYNDEGLILKSESLVQEWGDVNYA